MGRPLLAADQFDECLRLRREGHGLHALAERFGLTHPQMKMLLCNARRRANIYVGELVPVKSKRRDEVFALLATGLSANKVRKRLHMDWRTVQSLAREWQEIHAKQAATIAQLEEGMRAGVSAHEGAGVVEPVPATAPAPAPVLHDSYIESLMARGFPLHEARRQAELRRDRDRNGPRRSHREMFV